VEKYFFMKRVLDLISQGNFFTKVFSIALRVAAVVAALAGLVGFVSGWKIVFEMPAAGILGGIIFQALFVVAIYMVVHTLIIRANDIAGLPVTDFTVIPIASIFLKLVGEVYACFTATIAVGGGILMWFAEGYGGYLLRRVIPFMPSFGGESFLGGIVFILGGVLLAFFVLLFFYLMSESIVVMVEIAKNTKHIRLIAEQHGKNK